MPERIPFNHLAIESNVPSTSGIYMISNVSNDVIYVGKALDLCDRLTRHASGRSEKSQCLERHGAATFQYELWPPSQIAGEEEYAIGYYEIPICNETRR